MTMSTAGMMPAARRSVQHQPHGALSDHRLPKRRVDVLADERGLEPAVYAVARLVSRLHCDPACSPSCTTSQDDGRSWSDATLLPRGFLGPIKNKPIELHDDAILRPTSTESEGWKVHFEKFWYKSGRWETIGPINDGKEFGAIQPSLLTYFMDDPEKDPMQVLCLSRQGVLRKPGPATGEEPEAR